MDFTDQPLEPIGRTFLDATVKTELCLKTAMVFRILKLLRQEGYLPEYGHHMAEVCLEEALTNAMVHGNKLDPEKHVHVIVFGDAQRFGLIVEDEGKGFGPERIPDMRDPARMLSEHGREIPLISQYMEQVQYNPSAKRLRMMRQKQTRPDAGAHKPQDLPEVKSLIAPVVDLEGIDLTIGEDMQGAMAPQVLVPDEITLEENADLDSGGQATAGTTTAPAIPHDAAVSVHERSGVVVARFQTPRLTEDNVDEVRMSLHQAIARGKGLVLDMAEVEFMSSVGISTLLSAQKQVTMQKKRIVLASMGPALCNVLKASGILRVFHMEADQDAAIRKVKEPA